MKTLIQTKALTLSFVAGFVLSACGSGGGSGSRPLQNQDIDVSPDSVTWANPTQNQEEVCRRGTFTVKVGDSAACNWGEVGSAFRLFLLDTGPDQPIAMTSAFPQKINPNNIAEGCQFTFKPMKALLPKTRYAMSFWNTPVGSLGIQRDTVMFKTGDLLGSTCPAGDQFSAISVDGLPKSLEANNSDQFGSIQNGEYVFNWDDLGTFLLSSGINSLFGNLLGIGTVSTQTQIHINFNSSVNPQSAQGAIRIYEMQLSSGSFNGGLLTPVNVEVQVSGNQVTILPGASGYVPNKTYVLVVSRSLRSNADVYVDGSYFTPFTTGSN